MSPQLLPVSAVKETALKNKNPKPGVHFAKLKTSSPTRRIWDQATEDPRIKQHASLGGQPGLPTTTQVPIHTPGAMGTKGGDVTDPRVLVRYPMRNTLGTVYVLGQNRFRMPLLRRPRGSE